MIWLCVKPNNNQTTSTFTRCSNKEHVEEMKRTNDGKLAGLNAKLRDCESTLKSHRRELAVSVNGFHWTHPWMFC